MRLEHAEKLVKMWPERYQLVPMTKTTDLVMDGHSLVTFSDITGEIHTTTQDDLDRLAESMGWEYEVYRNEWLDGWLWIAREIGEHSKRLCFHQTYPHNSKMEAALAAVTAIVERATE